MCIVYGSGPILLSAFVDWFTLGISSSMKCDQIDALHVELEKNVDLQRYSHH